MEIYPTNLTLLINPRTKIKSVEPLPPLHFLTLSTWIFLTMWNNRIFSVSSRGFQLQRTRYRQYGSFAFIWFGIVEKTMVGTIIRGKDKKLLLYDRACSSQFRCRKFGMRDKESGWELRNKRAQMVDKRSRGPALLCLDPNGKNPFCLLALTPPTLHDPDPLPLPWAHHPPPYDRLQPRRRPARSYGTPIYKCNRT